MYLLKVILLILLSFCTALANAVDYSLDELEYIGFSPKEGTEREGLESILRGDEYEYGIPEKIFKLNFKRFSESKLWELGNIPSPKNNEYLSDFKRDVGKFRKLPLGLSSFTRNNEKLVNTNCFSCHSGVVAGKVIAGMPSTNFDANNQIIQTDLINNLYSNSNNLLQRLGRKVFLNQNQDKALKSFMDYYNKIVRHASRDAKLRGDNSGPWVVWYTLAKMREMRGRVDIDLKTKSDFEQTVLDMMKLPNVNPSPWWNLKYKERSFWLGDVSHHSPTTFSLNLMDQNKTERNNIQSRLERSEKHLDFARSVEAPKYPFEINFEKAMKGREIFMGNKGRCFKCHGDYDETGELTYYPETEAKNVGTDREYAKAVSKMTEMVDKAQVLFTDSKQWYAPNEETVSRKVKKIGYVPPPLKGIWASAPYFHNGSVPTLEGVLNSSSRPQVWTMDIDPFNYNKDQVGLVYQEVSEIDYKEMSLKQKKTSLRSKHLVYRRTYNTSEFGRSNSGHTKGDRLTKLEREELIEFLKML